MSNKNEICVSCLAAALKKSRKSVDSALLDETDDVDVSFIYLNCSIWELYKINLLLRLPQSAHSVTAQLVSQLRWKNTKDTIPQKRASICMPAALKYPRSTKNSMTTTHRPPVKANTISTMRVAKREIHQNQTFLPFLPQYHVIKYWIQQIVTTMR